MTEARHGGIRADMLIGGCLVGKDPFVEKDSLGEVGNVRPANVCDRTRSQRQSSARLGR